MGNQRIVSSLTDRLMKSDICRRTGRNFRRISDLLHLLKGLRQAQQIGLSRTLGRPFGSLPFHRAA